VKKLGYALALTLLAMVFLASFTPAKEVRLKLTGVFCDEDPMCHNRWHPAIKPVAHADPGDMIVYETRDALDTGFTMKNTVKDMAALDLGLVHPLTGPVFINGAKRGDVLEVEIIDIKDIGFGWPMIIPASVSSVTYFPIRIWCGGRPTSSRRPPPICRPTWRCG